MEFYYSTFVIMNDSINLLSKMKETHFLFKSNFIHIWFFLPFQSIRRYDFIFECSKHHITLISVNMLIAFSLSVYSCRYLLNPIQMYIFVTSKQKAYPLIYQKIKVIYTWYQNINHINFDIVILCIFTISLE